MKTFKEYLVEAKKPSKPNTMNIKAIKEAINSSLKDAMGKEVALNKKDHELLRMKSGNVMLSEVICFVLGCTVKDDNLYFSNLSLVYNDDTILNGALSGKHSLSDLVKAAKPHVKVQ